MILDDDDMIDMMMDVWHVWIMDHDDLNREDKVAKK